MIEALLSLLARQMPIERSGGGGSGTGGYTTVSYTEITANVNLTATTEATANTIVTAPAFTPDGTSRYAIIFYCSSVRNAGTTPGDTTTIWLYDNGASIGAIFGFANPAGAPMTTVCNGMRLPIPTAVSHTYSARGSDSDGTGRVNAGAGNAPGTVAPAFIWIVKLV